MIFGSLQVRAIEFESMVEIQLALMSRIYTKELTCYAILYCLLIVEASDALQNETVFLAFVRLELTNKPLQRSLAFLKELSFEVISVKLCRCV